ncbi:MAG: hypothetical protein WCA12_05880, partial [Burkholderiales bacterium]
RPAFALERLEQVREHELVYRLPRPQPDGTTQLRLTPLELIDRLPTTTEPSALTALALVDLSPWATATPFVRSQSSTLTMPLAWVQRNGRSKEPVLQSSRSRSCGAGRHSMQTVRPQFDQQNWNCDPQLPVGRSNAGGRADCGRFHPRA